MSSDSSTLDLLRAMLDSGPAITNGEHHRVTYRRPTLYHLGTEPAGAVISVRADHRFEFAFDESDGTHVSYGGTVSQDDLFRALYGAGLLKRRVTRAADA